MQPFPAPWRRLATLALAFLLCGAAWADPPGRVGRLAELQGTVWMYDTDQNEWVAAERNRPVTTGDRLSTDRDSRAELRIGSATVRLDADTQLNVTQLDDDRLRFELQHGSVAARLRNREVAAQFEVDTAEGHFLPQQAGQYRIDRDDELSAVTAWSGTLRFDATDSALSVPAGQRAEFWQESGVTHYTWATPPHDTFADWVLAADREDDRQATRYVSPEMTGSEDLDRYGRWETHPDYGAMWVPVQVAPGWAPYRYGHWAWVRPWGWTWVDDAPWGFAPFHYGRWAWWHDRWCWVPGGYAARPVYAPALVGWVGGPSVNVSVHVGSAPVVGWVPLAPREVYRPWYPLPREHWRYVNPHTPDRFYKPGEPPHGPVMYTNRGVPGGVTVVPADVLKERKPVNGFHVADSRLVQQLAKQPAVPAAAPPPPVAARPAPVVPRAAPNAPRPGAPSASPQTVPGAVPPAAAHPAAQPPAVQDGRRGHGVIVPPGRREMPATPGETARRLEEVQRPPQAPRVVPPSPPEAHRPAPPQGSVREVPRVPQARPMPTPPVTPPPVMSPPRAAEPRPAPRMPPPAAVREQPEAQRAARPRDPREGGDRGDRGEGREGREPPQRPGGPRQQVQ